jgi:DNA repair protein RadC
MKLYIKENDGTYRPASKKELVKAALTKLNAAAKKGKAMNNPDTVKSYLSLHMSELEAEQFAIMYLDNRNRLIRFERLFNGTIDGAAVYPREVVKSVLNNNAAAVILAHNHPSGIAEPSNADQTLTERLKTALNTIDVRVLDHIVVGNPDSVSFAERGLL